jgi:hypothetical protein
LAGGNQRCSLYKIFLVRKKNQANKINNIYRIDIISFINFSLLYFFSGILNDLCDNKRIVSLQSFGNQMESANGLSVIPKEEEIFFTNMFQQSKEMIEEWKQVFINFTHSPLFVDKPLSSSVTLTIFDVEDMFSNQWKVTKLTRFIEESYLFFMSSQSYYDRGLPSTSTMPLSNGLEDSEQIAQVENRPTLDWFYEFDKRIKAIILKIYEFQYITNLIENAELLEQRLQFLLRCFRAHQSKAKTEEGKKKLNFVYVCKVLDVVLQYPIHVPSARPFLSVMEKVRSWRQRVAELDDGNMNPFLGPTGGAGDGNETSSMTAAPARRSNRKTTTKNSDNKMSQGNQINIIEIESLIRENESYPFIFTYEKTVLAKKKEQAQEWIQRFKQLFSKSHGSGSVQSTSTLAANLGLMGMQQKTTLAELKMMISEGESMFLPSEEGGVKRARKGPNSAKSIAREMDKAVNAVEEAEDWLERFNDMLQSIYNECNNAQERYHEGETIAEEMQEDEIDEEEDEVVEDEDNNNNRTLADNSNDISESQVILSAGEKQEMKIMKKRKKMIDDIASFLQEARALPIIIQEAELLELQLKTLEWSMKVRPMLRLHSNYPSHQIQRNIVKPKLSDFITLKNEILR